MFCMNRKADFLLDIFAFAVLIYHSLSMGQLSLLGRSCRAAKTKRR